MKKTEETKIKMKHTHTHNLVIFKHKHKIPDKNICYSEHKKMHKQTNKSHTKMVMFKNIQITERIPSKLIKCVRFGDDAQMHSDITCKSYSRI